MKKTIFILFLILIVSNASIAQYGIGVSRINPTRGFANYFNPSFGLELLTGFWDEFDQSSMSFKICYYRLSSKIEAVPYYGINPATMKREILGDVYFDSYFSIPITITYDFHILDSEKFTPTIGAEFLTGFTEFHLVAQKYGVSNSNYYTGSFLLGIGPRFGLMYPVSDRIILLAGIVFNYSLEISETHNNYDLPNQTYWKAYFNIVYYKKKSYMEFDDYSE